MSTRYCMKISDIGKTICPKVVEQRGGDNNRKDKIVNNDPYRHYVGQQGYNMNKCRTFDEKNVHRQLCRLNVQSTPRTQNEVVNDNYLTINDSHTEKIVSCQNITPSYFPDMTLPMIGKRPVYSVRNCEYYIPDIILKDQDNLVNSEFDCIQPSWCQNCK